MNPPLSLFRRAPRRANYALLFLALASAILSAPAHGGPAATPPKWHPGHYIFVGHGEIRDELIALPHFRGIQRCYGWAKLEPERGRYDFSSIRRDLEKLRPHGKQLVLQIQYKAFGKDQRHAPAYLQGHRYGEERNPSGLTVHFWRARRNG